MKDVEFDERSDHLDIPVRPKELVEGYLAKELVKKSVAPSGTHANYILIFISILCFAIAIVYFALGIEKHSNQNSLPTDPTTGAVLAH